MNDFLHVTSDKANIYAVLHNGDLLWFKDLARNGTARWAANSGHPVGRGWDEFVHVFAAEKGVIYGIDKPDQGGRLLWYRDLAQDGTNGQAAEAGWVSKNGKNMNLEWNLSICPHVFYGGKGIIYAVDKDGFLYWYKDLARDGQTNWHPNSGNKIGNGWGMFKQIFADRTGGIYGITPDGKLYWYQDTARDGTNGVDAHTGWCSRDGRIIAQSGWGDYAHVFSGADCIIYAVTHAGELHFFKDCTTCQQGGLIRTDFFQKP